MDAKKSGKSKRRPGRKGMNDGKGEDMDGTGYDSWLEEAMKKARVVENEQ